ncbi:DUF6470 family protein [Virgibacillus sp. W0181]|uniref:DUF6470 family protein n=1 Tax=Virgibacillus sp. W0181 TaxID=3391581 RepID=UPI003F457D6B
MQLPQFRMESQLAQISIQQQAGKQMIKQPHADLSIEQPKAEISIEKIPSKLSIDQTQAWEEMNLMSTRKLVEKQAQAGLNSANEGTGRRAEQGTQLMRIELKSNPIKEQALVNGHNQMKRIGMKFIPSPFAVKIHYEPAEIKIKAQENKPVIQVVKNNPEISHERGNVEVAMEQYAQLEIDFIHLFSDSI